MRTIVSGILSLIQHNQQLATNSEVLRPNQCPTCGKSGLWHHGHYERKADYEHTGSDSLNPVAILRFYCPHCHTTCSVLPECIPPRRHYPWWIQQTVFLLLLTGSSMASASQRSKPSRWTISRWLSRFKSQFLIHMDHLRSLLPSLGRITEFIDSWRTLLSRFPLSHVMLNLNNAGVVIP